MSENLHEMNDDSNRNVDESQATEKTTPEITLEKIVSQHAPTNFDPSIHATNEDGSPKYRADGVTLAMKRGRKGAQKTSVETGHIENKPIRKQPTVDSSAATATMIVGMMEGLAVSAIGDEWAMIPEEKMLQESAWANYLRASGYGDLPPGVLLLCVTAGYVAPRLKHQNTRGKIAKFLFGTKAMFFKVKGFFTGRE
jgi:hypothetical protein